MTPVIAFDTLEFSQTLQKAGMQKELAEILSKTQHKVLEDVFSTKSL